jgi:uncharacterized lipoprotein NlpE involved in copper resistance
MVSSFNDDGRLINHSMKKITVLLSMIIICLSLYGCSNKTPEALNLEGKSDNWSASTNIPYTIENDDKYLKVTFVCSSVDHLFTESDVISFAIGTSVDSVVYSYSKTNGYMKDEYSSDPAELERINRVSDGTFEVLYDINVIDTSKKDSEQSIVIQVADEKIELLPVK